MLTAEGGDRSVTRNSSHFKKLHQDHADPVSVDINSSVVPVSVDTTQVQTQYQLTPAQVQVPKLNSH